MKDIYVILVDEKDNQIGVMEKMEAHRKANLHRALSVFIINSAGEWLLQKRAMDKYHSRGLWSNTCCSHPFPGENIVAAAKRRLMEEMGLHCELKELFSFIYKEKLDNEITEYEYDYVFAGISDEDPVINSDEVIDWKRINFMDLQNDVRNNPLNYTVWFRKIYQRVHASFFNHYNSK